MTATPLSTSALSTATREGALDFNTTRDIVPLRTSFGQERAEDALRLAFAVTDGGYNAFVMGAPGGGKHAFVKQMLEAHALCQPTPGDLCYVNNLSDVSRPRILALPAGRGRTLRDDMLTLVRALRMALRAAFEGADYRSRHQLLEQDVQQQHQAALEHVQRQAQDRALAFLRTPMGFAFAPKRDGEVISPEAFGQLTAEEQERIKADIAELERALASVLSDLPRLQHEANERIDSLRREVADFCTRPLFEDIVRRYGDLAGVLSWFAEVRSEVFERAELFVEAGSPSDGVTTLEAAELRPERWAEHRYGVNVLVERGPQVGAPVVYEDHPILENLVGRVEHRVHLGNLVTDFTLIKPGALHAANGGYLLLDAQKLLAQPQAYDALKRALRSRQIRVESLPETVGLAQGGRLTPEPASLSIKVALLGDRWLYYLLSEADPEFRQLFKVVADFADDVARTKENESALARTLAGITEANKLLALDRGAVACVIEHAARLAAHAGRLSTRLETFTDLLRESEHYALRERSPLVNRAHVEEAIRSRVHRERRLHEWNLRMLQESTLAVSTSGSAVGQVNGLSVTSLGDYAFGRPTRITCRVRLGHGEVLDIEREVKLGGPAHTKGVLILAGFLGARYGRDRPLSLSASLVFEQSYGGVDGDSASLAEGCALLSAIAEVPVSQRFAVTGSLNQMGEVQAIGAVNEKIEGFFDACSTKGLTGEQAVIIPRANVPHLMLRSDVIAAVETGHFSIHAVDHIDDALSLLTELEVGEATAAGNAARSFNARIEERLEALSVHAREYFVHRADRSPRQGSLADRAADVQTLRGPR